MDTIEELVWDTITNSAKKRFDYNDFAENMPGDPDMVLFKIIMGLAMKKDESRLAGELYGEFMMMGYMCEMDELKQLISDFKVSCKIEIFVAGLAADMLHQGHDASSVLHSINQFL